jgi:hypothetical protein
VINISSVKNNKKKFKRSVKKKKLANKNNLFYYYYFKKISFGLVWFGLGFSNQKQKNEQN